MFNIWQHLQHYWRAIKSWFFPQRRSQARKRIGSGDSVTFEILLADLMLAARHQTSAEFQNLIAKTSQADLDKVILKETKLGFTLLDVAACFQGKAAFKALFKKISPATLNKALTKQNYHRNTPLMTVARFQDHRTFQEFFEKASPETLTESLPIKDENGWTAIMIAAHFKSPEVFQALVEKAPLSLIDLSKDHIHSIKRKLPSIKSQHFFSEIVDYVKKPEKVILQPERADAFIKFCSDKIYVKPPGKICHPLRWLPILNKALQANPPEAIKNQLHGLSAYVDMHLGHSHSAKKHCLAISSPPNEIHPSINLLIADFLGAMGIQFQKKRLQHLYAAKDTDEAMLVLGCLLGESSMQRDDEKLDQIYTSKLKQLDMELNIKKTLDKLSHSFKIRKTSGFFSFFNGSKKTKATDQSVNPSPPSPSIMSC